MNGEFESQPAGENREAASEPAGSAMHHRVVRWTVLLLGLLGISLLGGCFVLSVHGHHPHHYYEYEYHERHDRDDHDQRDNDRQDDRHEEDRYHRIER